MPAPWRKAAPNVPTARTSADVLEAWRRLAYTPGLSLGTVFTLTVTIQAAVMAVSPDAAQVAVGPAPALTGRIVDSVGCPLIVAITLRRGFAPVDPGAVMQETRSDMDGRFTFPAVTPDNYWIEYTLLPSGGWGGDHVKVTTEGAYEEIHYSAPTNSSGDFKDWSIVVTDSDGIPIPSANVSWRRFSGAIGGPACGENTTTNRKGRAGTGDAPEGTYRVTVEASGYVPQTKDVRFGHGLPPTLTVRLLTPEETERAARTIGGCISESSPRTLSGATAGADAIVVGRINSAVLDPDYSYQAPWVLTRYDLQLLDVIKPHDRLVGASHIAILHNAGELDWGMYIDRGCYREMRTGETFVLFLRWNEDRHAFAPMGGDALIGNITSGEVAPIRASVTPGPIVTGAIGQPAVAYVRTIRDALTRPR
jgi:carboxypeptidase family protein